MRVMKKYWKKVTQPQKKSVIEFRPQGLGRKTLPSGAIYTMVVVLFNESNLDS